MSEFYEAGLLTLNRASKLFIDIVLNDYLPIAFLLPVCHLDNPLKAFLGTLLRSGRYLRGLCGWLGSTTKEAFMVADRTNLNM